jgi:hypothetical protein
MSIDGDSRFRQLNCKFNPIMSATQSRRRIVSGNSSKQFNYTIIILMLIPHTHCSLALRAIKQNRELNMTVQSKISERVSERGTNFLTIKRGRKEIAAATMCASSFACV